MDATVDTLADRLTSLGVPFQSHAPLASRTWYGVGGPARVLAAPVDLEQLLQCLRAAVDLGLPWYLLGSGANLLVADEGVDGLVIELSADAFREVEIRGSTVRVGAGFDLPRLITLTAKAGLSGLECLAGIPASVGGAIRMNAGGAFGDISRSVGRVRVLDTEGRLSWRDRTAVGFAYRHTALGRDIVIEAELALTPGDPAALMAEVERVMAYKKGSQPLKAHSAGCAFKNPTLPLPAAPGDKPPSAGALIDRAGLKGFRIGGAEVSPQHANFVVAHPGCRAADILAVMQHVQRVVHERFGVQLQREVVVWP